MIEVNGVLAQFLVDQERILPGGNVTLTVLHVKAPIEELRQVTHINVLVCL